VAYVIRKANDHTLFYKRRHGAFTGHWDVQSNAEVWKTLRAAQAKARELRSYKYNVQIVECIEGFRYESDLLRERRVLTARLAEIDALLTGTPRETDNAVVEEV